MGSIRRASVAQVFPESERGQILVIFALGLTVFVFILALILDGGRVYAERRRTQNAADAAATEHAICSGSQRRRSSRLSAADHALGQRAKHHTEARRHRGKE